MANNQSTFTQEFGYLIDQFDELQDLRWSDLQYLDEYRELKMKKNDGLPIDQNRLDDLEEIFKNKIVTSARWNKFQNALVNMQTFIKTEIEGYVLDKQQEMETFATEKKGEVQTEIDKFQHKGTYNPSIQYYQKNTVDFDDGTGSQVYIALKDTKGNDPTNSMYWKKLTIQGARGEKGFDGVGLKFKGEYKNTTIYAKDDGVQFGGVLFASLIDGNLDNQPDLTQDTPYWAKALDVTVTVRKMIGTRNIATQTSNVNFITGEITSFNPSVDSLEVYQNSIRLTKGIDYNINSNNQSIDKIVDIWDASSENTIFFEFVITKNILNDLVFSDGSSIANGTVAKNKLTTDIQDDIDKIGILNTKVSPETALNTTSQNLSGAVNEVKSDLETHKANYVTFKNNIEAVKYEDDKLFLKVNGEWIEFKSGSQYPVGNVSGLKVDEDDMQVTINWIDPPDLTINDSLGNPITLSKWAGTQLRRKKLSYPSSENDGELVVDSKIRDQYKTNGYIDSGLVNDEEYFYMLFPYTEDGAFTVDSANRISATPTEIDPDTWAGVQKIVRKGLASEYFNVGDQLVSAYDGGEITWEVIGLDVDTPVDSNFAHSMTIQTKDCLHNIQFDAKEPNNPDSNRKNYGNNRYIHSAVRQWLNSNQPAFVWKSQHSYDATPTDSLDLYEGAGFLSRLDPELAAVIGEVSKKVALNTATDGGGQESFNDKVFLLSQKEVGLGEEGDVTGEFVYPFYDGISNAGRIKQLNGSNMYWWLRSPHVSSSYYVRSVNTDGSLDDNLAYTTSGVSPACVII